MYILYMYIQILSTPIVNTSCRVILVRCIWRAGFTMIRVYCHCVNDVMLMDNVNSNLNHSLLSELPSASTRFWHIRVTAAVHPLQCEESRCRTSQSAKCFLPAQVHMWNGLPYIVFTTLSNALSSAKWNEIIYFLPSVKIKAKINEDTATRSVFLNVFNSVFLSAWCLFVLNDLWNVVLCF